MEAVINFFKSLALKDSDIHLSSTSEDGEQIIGLFVISFVKSDGTEINAITNDSILTFVDDKSYEIQSTNFHDGLVQAFTEGLSIEK